VGPGTAAVNDQANSGTPGTRNGSGTDRWVSEVDAEPTPDEPQPIVPTSEKVIGAFDLGLVVGTVALVIGLVLIRRIKAKAREKLADAAVQVVDSVV
jgi:hypothetical protein